MLHRRQSDNPVHVSTSSPGKGLSRRRWSELALMGEEGVWQGE
jgi:hypothetical protein